VYAGFVWELVQQLQAAGIQSPIGVASKLVMDAAEMNPANIPDAIRLSYVADDDDGDLSNGTPHSKQLAAAANSRLIPLPD
jgi:hypothetical protein